MALSPRMTGDEIWEAYVRHFSFSQLNFIFTRFVSDADNDELKSMEKVHKNIETWLRHQWGGCLTTYDINEEWLAVAFAGLSLPLNFYGYFRVLLLYQQMHIQHEDGAGFDPEDVDSLKEIYEKHHKVSHTRGSGLQGKALFAVLEDLGIKFEHKEDRLWYIDIVQKLDKNKDGSINFPQLCQIIRQVEDMELERKRLREFSLIKQSGLPFDEVEDWFELFNEQDAENSGELQRHQVKDLITSIGVSWDKEMAETITQWVNEADMNNNGTIDFAEFCIIVSKLWKTNFHGIRAAARKYMGRELVVSFQSVSGMYVSANQEGQAAASSRSLGTDETFTMTKLPNGNIILQSAHGPYLSVDIDVVQCVEGKKTEFKVETLEDERVIMTASTAVGGVLFGDPKGKLGISDGDPATKAYYPFTITLHDSLMKKNWSKVKPAKPSKRRRPSKVRTASKEVPAAAPSTAVAPEPVEDDPTSPGLKEAIALMDEALLTNRSHREAES